MSPTWCQNCVVRGVLAVVVALVVLTGCGVSTALPVPPAPPSRTTPAGWDCSDGVVVTAGVSDAATGLRVLALELTNCGEDPYTIAGYPEVRVIGADGAALRVDAAPGGNGIDTVADFDAPPTSVTLRPGETAVSGLVWRNTVLGGRGPALLGTALDVRPTPDADWRRVADPSADTGLHIDLGTTGRLGVRPWSNH